MPYPAGPSHEILSLLFEITQASLEPSDAAFHTERYREYIKVLEWRVKQTKLEELDVESSIRIKDGRQTTKLYQLATLIYLERTSRSLPPDTTKVAQWVQNGLQILEDLGVCRWPLILFIFGFEARSDRQRKQILGFVSRVEDLHGADKLQLTQQLVQFSWTQDDLGAQDLGYLDRIDAVMSISGTVPAFV